MASFLAKPKPPKLLQVLYDDGSSTDTDSDDDLSLSDLPIKAPSPAGNENGRYIPSGPLEAAESEDDNDPFEFFSSRLEAPGICSPPDVFFGGRMLSTDQGAPASTTPSTTSPPLREAVNPYGSKPVYSGSGLPPVPLSRRSRSEAVRRPPRDPAAYNRSASLEGRGKAWGECFGNADRKGEYRRLPPLRAAHSRSASSSKKSSGGTPCIVDAVPSCGPRPKWYVFATFASVKPPQGGMDIKDMRTRQQKKRSTQQQQQSEGVVSGAKLAASRVGGAGGGGRPGRKSWLLNSLSCKVDVDSLPWTPSDLPMPFPGGLTHLEGAPRWR